MGIVKTTLYKFSNVRFLNSFKKESIFPYYHIVKSQNPAHIKHLYPFKNPQQFIEDIELIQRHYQPINFHDLQKEVRPENAVLFSFDDGLSEIYTDIFPILKEKKVPAIFFINPTFVDNHQVLYKHKISLIIDYLHANNFKADSIKKINKIFGLPNLTNDLLVKKLKSTSFANRHKIDDLLKELEIDIEGYLKEVKPYITKSQIQEMIDAGFYFGGHTMSHSPLDQLTHEQQKAEIIDSIEWLKKNFELNYSCFAFPFSDKGISRKLINELFDYDANLLLFGNSGMKKDIDYRIIQRFSLEHPKKDTAKVIVTENWYKIFNKLMGKYHIQRR